MYFKKQINKMDIIPRENFESSIEFLQQFRYVSSAKRKKDEEIMKKLTKTVENVQIVEDVEVEVSDLTDEIETLEIKKKDENNDKLEKLKDIYSKKLIVNESPLASFERKRTLTAFTCLRCDYTSPYKTFLLKHLKRKTICPSRGRKVTLDDAIEDAQNQYAKCDTCSEQYVSYKLLEKHQTTKGNCQKHLNPDQRIYVIRRTDKENFIKIGIYQGTQGSLLTRYRTHLGNDFELVLFYQTKYAAKIETEIKKSWAMIRDCNQDTDELNEWYNTTTPEAIIEILDREAKMKKK